MEAKNKKIYIVLTYTGTILSKIIRTCTNAKYCHVSISLDKKLNKMYSFGRLNPYNPFIGGFVHEGINIGTFKRFKNTRTEIYSIEVTNNQYRKIKKEIKNIESKKEEYKFNMIGLVLAGVNFKFERTKRYYCAEFVRHLTDEAEIDLNLSNAVKPMDFKRYNNLELLYKGILRNYNAGGIYE